jgi:hypothetical protein
VAALPGVGATVVASATALALGMLAGFAIGGAGHLYGSRTAIVVGIVVIMLSAAIFVLATNPSFGG